MNKGAIPVPGDDGCRPGMRKIFIGNNRTNRAPGREHAHVPDLRFIGPNPDDRVHLAINPLLPPGGGIGSIITRRKSGHLVALKIHFRERHGDLAQLPLVLGPGIQRISHHNEAGQSALHLPFAHFVHVRVIPVQPHAVLIALNRNHHLHRVRMVRMRMQLDIDIIRLAQTGRVRAVIMEVGSENGIGRIIGAGQLIMKLNLQGVTGLQLQHRSRKSSTVISSISFPLIRHRIVRTICVRVAINLLAPVENRVNTKAS